LKESDADPLHPVPNTNYNYFHYLPSPNGPTLTLPFIMRLWWLSLTVEQAMIGRASQIRTTEINPSAVYPLSTAA